MPDHDDLRDRRRQLADKRRQTTLERLGLTDPGVLREERASLEELRRVTADEAKLLADRRGDPAKATAALVDRARGLSRRGGRLLDKPDPFGPIDVRTDGPSIDYGVPSATATVCDLTFHSVLDTSANHGLTISPDEAEGDPRIEPSAEFDATAGVNEARFRCAAAGAGPVDALTFACSVGFRFNFHPPTAGRWAFSPVATLAAAWSTSALSAIGGRASLRLALHAHTLQSAAEDPEAAQSFVDAVFVDEESLFGADGGALDIATPDGAAGPLAMATFDAGLLVRVGVSALAIITVEGLGQVEVDALADGLGLAVPEVHVFSVDCFSMPLDTAIDVGKPLPEGPPIPDRPGPGTPFPPDRRR